MYDLMQTFRRLQIVETSDDEENDELWIHKLNNIKKDY
jgi:hypothetical protein